MVDSISDVQKVLGNVGYVVSKSKKVPKDKLNHEKRTQGASLNQLPVIKFRTIWPLKRIVIIIDYNILNKKSLKYTVKFKMREKGDKNKVLLYKRTSTNKCIRNYRSR